MRRKLSMRALIATATIGVMGATMAFGSVAARADDTDNAPAPIQAGNGECGANLSYLPTIGFVIFHHQDSTVSLNVHLQGAAPNTTYNVFLFENAPQPCQLIGNAGTVTTNSQGVGNGHFVVTVPPDATAFFADVTPASSPFSFPSNDTSTVTLP